MFVISDGGQWLYEPAPVRSALQEDEPLGLGVISTQHRSFREAQVPVTAQMHNNLMWLLQDEGGVVSNRVLCHQQSMG